MWLQLVLCYDLLRRCSPLPNECRVARDNPAETSCGGAERCTFDAYCFDPLLLITMPIHTLLFDLDETLYPRSAGVMPLVGQRIRRYISEVYGLSMEEADALAQRYYRDYGTSMRGLYLHYGVDTQHFLEFVHQFPLDHMQPDPALDAMLARLPGCKVIFTNASAWHAERVLARLGIRRHFERIIDVVAFQYASKPHPQAYQTCLDLLQVTGSDCLLIEDTARNIPPATALGMTTVLVDGDPAAPADYHIATILELELIIHQLDIKACRM